MCSYDVEAWKSGGKGAVTSRSNCEKFFTTFGTLVDANSGILVRTVLASMVLDRGVPEMPLCNRSESSSSSSTRTVSVLKFERFDKVILNKLLINIFTKIITKTNFSHDL